MAFSDSDKQKCVDNFGQNDIFSAFEETYKIIPKDVLVWKKSKNVHVVGLESVNESLYASPWLEV